MTQTEEAVTARRPSAPLYVEPESGQEAGGFESVLSDLLNQRNTESQRKRARPTSVDFQWNFGALPAQRGLPTPPAYWGTFITTFDGTVLAGARNDGLGSLTAGWAAASPVDPDGKYSNGAGGNTSIITTTNVITGLSGALCGFDIFLDTTQTNIDVFLVTYNPHTALTQSFPLVLNKVPQIGSYKLNAQPLSDSPVLIIRRRPEGYKPNEDGAQVFFRPSYANTVYPAGCPDPVPLGVPTSAQVTRITTGITP